MARFTTAFSLTHEVLNEIEARKGNDNRSGFVDKTLRTAFNLPEIPEKKHNYSSDILIPSEKTDPGEDNAD